MAVAVTRNGNTKSTLRFVLASYIFVFIIKLAVYFESGVLVVLAEALHTLNDIVISGFLLAASHYASKKADDKHMYGHGRLQNAAAFLASILFISVTSYKLYDEAIHELLIHPIHSYQHMEYAIAMFVISSVVCAVPMIKMLMQEKWDATLKAQFVELINDQLSVIAALIGTFFIMRGYPLADPIATLVVATIIAINAAMLFMENLSFLLGRSPGAQVLTRFVEIARSVPGVIDVHGLRAEYVGPDEIHTDLHIRVKRGQPVEDAHLIADQVYKRLAKEAGCPYCVIHVDPAHED
jgi:cation diffusion facilitator family transporter